MKPSSSKSTKIHKKPKCQCPLKMPPSGLLVMPPFDFLAKLEHQRQLSSYNIFFKILRYTSSESTLIRVVMGIERQVLQNWYQYLLSQSLHNSACVGWGNSSTWYADSLLHNKYYADVTADAPALHMYFVVIVCIISSIVSTVVLNSCSSNSFTK